MPASRPTSPSTATMLGSPRRSRSLWKHPPGATDMLGVIGDVVQDIVVWTEEEVRHATDTKSQIRMTRGGSAANVAAFAGRRHPTRFIGCVGNDLGGHVVEQELESHGVDEIGRASCRERGERPGGAGGRRGGGA